jgi:Ca-activated chloride channel family protein
VVAFAGRGSLRCPLTENLGAVLDVIGRLRAGGIQPGGTDLGAGLDAAIEAFDDQEHEEGRTIVVFSDGEDHMGAWDSPDRQERFRKAGVLVHAVAIGDPEAGHPVPIGSAWPAGAAAAGPTRAAPERPGYLTYQGHEVLSRRDDVPLESITKQTGGTVIRLGLASADLGTLYQTRIEPVARQTRVSRRVPELVERFPLFLLAAVVMGIVATWPGRRVRLGLIGLSQFVRRRWRASVPARLKLNRRRPAASATLTMLVLALIAGDRPPSTPSVTESIAASGKVNPTRSAVADGATAPGLRSSSVSAAAAVEAGVAAYRRGQYEAAFVSFEAAASRVPDRPEPRYDAAAALFQLGRFVEARERYREARERAGPALRTKIDFAMGNAALVQGEIAEAIAHYDDCLASKAAGSGLDGVRGDAAINRRYAMEQLKTPGEETRRDPSSEERDESTRQPDAPRPTSGEAPSQKKGQEAGHASPSRNQGGSGQERQVDASDSHQDFTGGGGGEGSEAGSRRNRPPGDRLDDAIQQIRAARRWRLPNEEPPEGRGAQDDRKDW